MDQPGRTWETWSRSDGKGLSRYVLVTAARLLRVPASAFDLNREVGGRRALVRALYDELLKKQILYDTERYEPLPNRQWIRTPHEILKAPGQGTCLDLSLLFCGLCLACGLIPILVVLDGHALVLVSLARGLTELRSYGRRERVLFDEGLLQGEGSAEEIVGLVESGDYVAVECTGFARTQKLPRSVPEGVGRDDGFLPFERALEAGRENLSNTDRPIKYALDVARLHELGFTPFEPTPGVLDLGVQKPAVAPELVGSASGGLAASAGIAFETITLLEGQLRTQVDRAGKSLSDEVGKAFGTHDFDRVISFRPRLLDWLSGEGQTASRPVRGSLFALLADIALLEAGLGAPGPRVDVSFAREFYRQALGAYGAEIRGEDEARLTTLRAKIECLSGHMDAALGMVQGRNEASCLSLRLSILIEQGRFDLAAGALAGLPYHEKWCDRAITARLMVGDRAGADEILAWAREREDPSCYQRCLLAHAQAAVLSALGGPEASSRVRPHTLGAGQVTELSGALVTLLPLLGPGEGLGRPGAGLEREAHALAVRIGLLTRNVDRIRRSAAVLDRANPLPIEVGNAAIQRYIPTPDDLPARLRRDHPASLEAHILASILEARRLGRSDDAYLSLVQAAELAATDDDKEELCRCLFEIASSASDGRVGEVAALAGRLLGEDHPLAGLAQAFVRIEADDLAGAGEILEKHRAPGDPLWLQVAVKKKLGEGDKAGAVEDLISSGMIVGSTDLLRYAAFLARSAGLLDRAAYALEQLLELDGGDLDARKALAMTLLDVEEYGRAACELATLRQRGVIDREVVFNHGVALCNSGRPREALDAFRDVAARHPEWHIGLGACAQLLHELGHSDEAFRLLHRERERFWSEPRFLMQYVRMAHASSNEEEAGEGLRRLLELEKTEEGASSSTRLVTIERCLEMAQEQVENHKEINRMILVGGFPWLLAGVALGRGPSRDWSFRTQPMNVGDHPLHRAEFAVYATNGFRVTGADEPGRKFLSPTTCPPRGAEVVTDLSGILTLDRVGVLDEALSYFGKALVPGSYQPELLHEQGRLRPIQPARLAGLRAIRDAADRGRLCVLAPGEAPDVPVTKLNEFLDPSPPGSLGAVDVANYLLGAGLLSNDRFNAVRDAARRSDLANSEDVQAAVEAGALLADEFTLALLRENGALDPLLDTARVYIDQAEIERIRAALRAAEFDGEILKWHEALREKIASDPRLVAVPVPAPGPVVPAGDAEAADHEAAGGAVHRSLALHAYQIAQARSLPLLVDDRVLQAIALNESPDSPHAAFGTGDVLAALVEAGVLDIGRASMAFLELIRLRYRFLLPPTSFLIALARQHRSHPPGEPLREVARYAHDCMRDPGLLAGLEPTEPPISMAVYLFQQWASRIGEFIVAVWQDDDFDVDAAATVTHWAIRELLPSIPRNCPPALAGVLAQKLPMVVLSGALVHPPGLAKLGRMNRALGEIARAFALSDERYTEIVADILLPLIEGAESDAGLPIEIVRAFAHAALSHLGETSHLAHYALVRLGLSEPATSECALSAVQLRELADGPCQPGVPWPGGPLALVSATDGAPGRVVVPVLPLLLDEEHEVRVAAVSFLRSLAATNRGEISERSRAVVGEYSEAVLSTERLTWYPAATRIVAVLRQDYPLNLSGFRQELWASSRFPQQGYWAMLIRPGRSLVASVEPDQYSPDLVQEEASSEIERMAREPSTLREVLDVYTDRFGHLPLAPPLSLGTVVARWIGSGRETRGVWDDVWGWVEETSDPVRLHHACRLFLEVPGLVPEGVKRRFWAELAGALRSSHSAVSEAPGGRSWALRTDVARLYLLQLESHVPGHDPDQLARLAWWGACQLVCRIESPGRGRATTDEFLRRVHEGLVEPVLDEERVLGRVGIGVGGITPFSYVTTYGGCPWALSLLSALGPEASLLDPGDASEDARSAVTDSLILHLVLGFPLASEAGITSPFGFGATLARAAMLWGDVEPDEFKRLAIAKLLEFHARLADPRAFLETLRGLHTLEGAERRLCLNAFAGLAHCGDLPADEILQVVCDPVWFRRAMLDLSHDEVGRLLDALIAIVRRSSPDWTAAIPHLIAGSVELDGLPAGRRDYLLQNVILACAASGTASALRRISLGKRPSRHAEAVRHFREVLESYLPAASPWAASRLRDILSSLPASARGGAMLPAPPRG